MSNQGANPFFRGNIEITSGLSLDSANEYDHFPKDFERKLKDVFDRRFVVIWLISFVVHFSTAVYFSINPPHTTIQRAEIDRIQKQFATLVLDKKIEETSPEPEIMPTENITTGEGNYVTPGNQNNTTTTTKSRAQPAQTGETKVATSVAPGYPGNFSGNDKRSASRKQISQEVSSKGLLGLLTGSGSQTRGESVSDVLGEAANTQTNFDKVMGDLDGLRKSGKSSAGSLLNQGTGRRSQKGTRSTTGGSIDSLVSGKQQVSSAAIQRKGNIVVEQVSSIADERGIKSESRDPDKVSEIINGHNSSIQYCYQRELRKNQDLKGKLVVRFTVTPAGKVSEVKIVSSTLNNSRIERCVITRIRRWDDFGQIDPSHGDATFRQVYTFGY